MATIPGSEEAAQILQVVSDSQLTGYLAVLSLTTLVYDHIVGMEEEVRLMWPRPWGAFNYLYFWSRYFTLLMMALNANWLLREIKSDHVCQLSLHVEGVTGNLVVVVVDMILLLRVWVLCGRPRVLFHVFWALLLAELVALLVVTILTAKQLIYFIHVGPLIRGCYSLTGVPKLFQFYAVPALFVSLLGFFLTLHQCSITFLWNGHTEPPITNLFLRDGALWFLVVSSILITEMVVLARARPSLAQLLILPCISAYSVIGSRVLLNIKNLVTGGEAVWETNTTTETENIVFRTSRSISTRTIGTAEP